MVLALLTVFLGGSLQSPDSGLVVPPGTSPSEKASIARVGSLVSHGDFDQAAAAARPLTVRPVVRVWVDWAPVSSEAVSSYRAAWDGILARWNKGLGPKLRFQSAVRKEEADLVFFFERSIGEAPGFVPRLDFELGTAADHRTGAAYIGLRVPGADTLRDPSTISRLLAYGLGQYLGVGVNLATKSYPEASDCEVALKLQDVRSQLLNAAEKHVTLRMPQPLMHIEQSSLELGDVLKGDFPQFEYKVENKGDAPLEIEAKPGCGCTLVKFDSIIPAGGTGVIHAQLNTSTLEGKVTKSIDVTGNDLDHPKAILTLTAHVISAIQFVPAKPAVVRLRDDQPTQEEIAFRIPTKVKTDVKAVTASASYVTPSFEVAATTPDYTEYKVKMAIGTQAPVGMTSFLLTVVTGSQQQIKSSVVIPCQKGIALSPPSLFLGSIRPDTSMPVKQWVVIRRLGRGFKITKIDNDDANLSIEQTPVAEGDGYRLAFTYNGGWPAGPVSRSVVIHTDEPLQPSFTITVFAQVSG